MSTVLPLTAAASCLFAAGAIVYSKLRPKFSVKVNCWFCQQDMIVPYEEQNSWDCPHCEQYNGFTEDGGYNKIIAAQYEEFLNDGLRYRGNIGNSATCGINSSTTTSSVLCATCSINQQLKIKQLASFVPSREERFDLEISNYKAHLERVYRLCQNCDSVLQGKLAKEETWLRPKILHWKLQSAKQLTPFSKTVARFVKMITSFTRIAEPAALFLYTIAVLLSTIKVEDPIMGGFFANYPLIVELFEEYFWVLPIIGVLSTIWRLSIRFRKLSSTAFGFAIISLWILTFSFRTSLFRFLYLCLLIGIRLATSFFESRATSPASSATGTKIRNLTSDVYLGQTKDSPPKNLIDLDSSIEKLKIGTQRRSTSPLHSFSESPSSICSSSSIRKRPLLSPSRLDHSAFKVPSSSNLTKTSWVAGGYWQNSYSPTVTPLFPLSRSSSQSSGIGSIRSGYRGHLSPPGSRPGSACAELDCFSFCSDEPDSPESNEVQFSAQNAPMPQKCSVPVSYTWAIVIFLLGFSLAVNVCICAYLYFR